MDKPKEIVFSSDDENSIIHEFRPNLTPSQIFKMGSFGGTYWRPIDSQVTGKRHSNRHLKFEKLGWWKGIPDDHLTLPYKDYNTQVNKYKVKCGTTLEFWESKTWITKEDPYGWVEWYCNFYNGRRSKDDQRQIKRWLAFCGPKGRFKRNLVNKINAKNGNVDDFTVSPVIRQSLQHWAYQVTKFDLTKSNN